MRSVVLSLALCFTTVLPCGFSAHIPYYYKLFKESKEYFQAFRYFEVQNISEHYFDELQQDLDSYAIEFNDACCVCRTVCNGKVGMVLLELQLECITISQMGYKINLGF